MVNYVLQHFITDSQIDNHNYKYIVQNIINSNRIIPRLQALNQITLQPSKSESDLIIELRNRLGLKTVYQWVDDLTDPAPVLNPIPAPVIGIIPYSQLFFNRTGEEIENLYVRSNAIVSDLIINRKSNILLMDGHGRTLYFIIYLIRQARGNPAHLAHFPGLAENITITICDIDVNVMRWHNNFFPTSSDNITIVNTEGNIFDLFLPINPDGGARDTILVPYINQTVIYLNFCGFGESFHVLKTLLTEIYQKVVVGNIYISTNYTMGSIGYVNELFFFNRDLNPHNDQNRNSFRIPEICHNHIGNFRSDFKTFAISHAILAPLGRDVIRYGGYYNKYLKYKLKYLKLKEKL
uniref:Uncharacterized protein n=1 Tax=viral metagenome TaxID=1070528 RepID=A0A6C0H0Q3_9ZZZZ